MNSEEDIVHMMILELEWFSKNVISFPIVYKKVCPALHIRKNEARVILYKLKEKGYIEVFPFHGIRIKS
jgi:hypothetical protein